MWNVIAHLSAYFNGGFNKQPMKLEQGWVIASYCYMNVITYQRLNHDANLVNLCQYHMEKQQSRKWSSGGRFLNVSDWSTG